MLHHRLTAIACLVVAVSFLCFPGCDVMSKKKDKKPAPAPTNTYNPYSSYNSPTGYAPSYSAYHPSSTAPSLEQQEAERKAEEKKQQTLAFEMLILRILLGDKASALIPTIFKQQALAGITSVITGKGLAPEAGTANKPLSIKVGGIDIPIPIGTLAKAGPAVAPAEFPSAIAPAAPAVPAADAASDVTFPEIASVTSQGMDLSLADSGAILALAPQLKAMGDQLKAALPPPNPASAGAGSASAALRPEDCTRIVYRIMARGEEPISGTLDSAAVKGLVPLGKQVAFLAPASESTARKIEWKDCALAGVGLFLWATKNFPLLNGDRDRREAAETFMFYGLAKICFRYQHAGEWEEKKIRTNGALVAMGLSVGFDLLRFRIALHSLIHHIVGGGAAFGIDTLLEKI